MSLIEKYVFNGENNGLNLLILGGVHGNETAGVKAGLKVISELQQGKIKLKNGRLTIVPVCNPEAYKKGVRSVEENLNRVMKIHQNPQSYEQRLANEICPLIKESRMLLDLHSTHCQGDVPFAFCDYADEYDVYSWYFYAGFPLIIALLTIIVLFRPLYIISACRIYINYACDEGIQPNLPQRTSSLANVLVIFICLTAVICIVLLYHQQLGIDNLMSAK